MTVKSSLLVILIVCFFSVSGAGASLAPQVYLTDIGVNKTSFEPGEEIEGFVSVLNYEDMVVSDLVLNFQLLGGEIDGVATKTIDKQISQSVFTLEPGMEIRRVFYYTLPSNLPQGSFKFRVQATNSRGEEMGWIDKIISIGGDDKFLFLDNHWFIRNNEKLSPGGGVNYRVGQLPEVEIDIKNNSFFSIDAFAKIVTYKRNVGDILEEENGNPVILERGEKRTLKFSLAQLNTPESYLSEIRFYNNKTKEAISNPVYFRWIVIGEDAEILFVKTDKTSYKSGEEARIEIQLAGASSYLISYSQTGLLEVKLFNAFGGLAGEARKEIELADSKVLMAVPIVKDVENPRIKTSIARGGNIIDRYNFRVVPPVELVFPEEKAALNIWISISASIFIFAVLIFILLFIYYARRNKTLLSLLFLGWSHKRVKNKARTKKYILFLLIILGASFLFLKTNRALAAVEITGGCRDILMIYNTPLPNRIYNLNDVINFSGKFKTAGPSSSLFFNKISFYIAEDRDILVQDCCGSSGDDCLAWQPDANCQCREGYVNYYGASSSFYDFSNKKITWTDEVKFLSPNQKGLYKLGTIYPSDTVYGNPWVAYNQSFIIPENLGFFGPVRFYVQYSGTCWNEYWQWSVTYQNGWLNENKPPYVENPELDGEPSYCTIGPGKARVSLKWTYQDEDRDKESEYELQIANDSSFSKESLMIDSQSSIFKGESSGSINTSPSVIVSHKPNSDNFEIAYNVKYWWRVRVKDEAGNWSQWKRGPEFTTALHAYPWPKLGWQSEKIIAGETFSFIDAGSKCYRKDGSEYNCKEGGKGISYQWDFSYQPLEGFTLDSTEIEPSHTYSEAGEYIVRLQLADDIGFCVDSSKLLVKQKELIPPGWKPTAPSSLLEKFLSQVSFIFLQK